VLFIDQIPPVAFRAAVEVAAIDFDQFHITAWAFHCALNQVTALWRISSQPAAGIFAAVGSALSFL